MKPASFCVILILCSGIALTRNSEASAGDLYEADFSSGIVYRFSPAGARSVFVSGLSGPEGMAFDSSGNFYISETGNGTINKFTPGGTRTAFATGLNGPASLVFDDSGNLYDADFFGGVIHRFAPNGTRTTFATGLHGPANLVFDSGGNLLEADFNTGTIFRFASNGARSTFATGVGRPHGLAFDRQGNLFAADFQGGTILKFTPNGERTTFATGLDGPHGITFDSAGDLFTADYNSGSIFKFAPSGARSTFATGLSNPANLQFQPWVATAGKLLNLSTRAFVGTDTRVLIGGFILQGSQPTTVVLRAIGPSLASRGVNDALEDPSLELRNAAGALVASNDNWENGPNAAAIQSVGLAPQNAKESALRATLQPGSYTAVVRGVGNATPVGGTQPGITGIGLVELYDLQQGSSRAVNISTRGTVLSGDNVMIAGCIISGITAKQIAVRAIGPSLRGHGVSDALGDPRIQLFDANGVAIEGNDNWQDGPNATVIRKHGLAPESPLESAAVVNLAPGNYTCIESPAPGTSGVGLIEIYDLS